VLWRKDGSHENSSFPACQGAVRYGGAVIEG
jgi:hypothetical protein